MSKSSLMQHIMLKQIMAGQKVVFIDCEVFSSRWNKWRTQEQKEHTQNRWNARKLKRHLNVQNLKRQTRKI